MIHNHIYKMYQYLFFTGTFVNLPSFPNFSLDSNTLLQQCEVQVFPSTLSSVIVTAAPCTAQIGSVDIAAEMKGCWREML